VLANKVFLLFQELELDKFVTHEVNFEDINKAFDLLLEGKSLRCVIWMDKKASYSKGVCIS
jgi:S-(hydroxymethyl)glutathione dehydrogenase/alcohol dehydrogenase